MLFWKKITLLSGNAILESDNAILECDNAILESDNAILESDNAILGSECYSGIYNILVQNGTTLFWCIYNAILEN